MQEFIMPDPEAIAKYAQECVDKAREANPQLTKDEEGEIVGNAYMDVMTKVVSAADILEQAKRMLGT